MPNRQPILPVIAALFIRSTLAALTVCTVGGLAAQTDAPLVPGNSLFSEFNHIEYIPGDLPIILAVPHGGHLMPAEIPCRAGGVLDTDANTQELGRTIAAVLHERTGHHIHVVISRLHRSKLDPNRDLPEAAEHDVAVRAWAAYHRFIEDACEASVSTHGSAFLIDLHGHGHKQPRVELGYTHSALDLADCEERINEPPFAASGSLGLVAERSQLPYTELLHGPTSLGALLESNGFLATPSPRLPIPDEPFFRGGYTVRHHCDAARQITGVQIEANRSRLRDTSAHRLRFAQAFSTALADFLQAHLPYSMEGAGEIPLPPTRQVIPANQPAQ